MVRFKSRYLLFRFHLDPPTDGPLSVDTSVHGATLNALLKESIEFNFGDYGAGIAATSTTIKYYSPYTNMGIIRCARDHYQLVWAALTLTTKMKGKSVLFRVMHVGGTIKSVQEEAIKVNKTILLDLQRRKLVSATQVDSLLTDARKQIEEMEM